MARRGFTLIELLVVIAIIGVLVAILLPAIQKVREAANRSSCQNNLKQLGIALHSYQETNQRFPYGGKSYGGCVSNTTYVADSTAYNGNGLVQLLPFLEQTQVYQRFDPNAAFSELILPPCGAAGTYAQNGPLAGGTATINAPFANQRIPTLGCPSDTGNPRAELSGNACYGPAPGYQGYKTNYDFSVAPGDINCNYWKTAISARRMFGENSTTTPADVTDGLSNTVAMSERLYDVYNGTCTPWAYRSWVQVGVDISRGMNVWYIAAYGAVATVKPRPGQLISWEWAGSLHPSGCNMLFGDGAVRFVSENTTTTVLTNLAIMADGNVVSPEG